MVVIEGTQDIPAERLDQYRATLGEATPGKMVRKRYPYRLPKMQASGFGASAKQKAQQARFKIARNDFNKISQAERQKWYAARPVWNSYLWYYNYFIMSSLSGNADISDGGAGVIKSIQNVKQSVPTTGGSSFAINTVDPAKTVVMVYGSSYISDKVQRGSNSVADGGSVNIALSPNVDIAISEVILRGQRGLMDIGEGSGSGDWTSPYVSALTTSQLTVALQDVFNDQTCYFSWQIIEHKAQTVYPVIASIAAAAIGIDWSKVPSVAADVSIIVIEYI